MSTDVVGFQGSMIRDMAEAVTQWEQLNPPQGGEPEKPRNLVLLGKQHSHPHPHPAKLLNVVPWLPQFLGALRFLDAMIPNPGIRQVSSALCF